MRRIISGRFSGQCVDIDFIVVFDSHGHEGMTLDSHAPAAGVGDSGKETANVQAFEVATHPARKTTLGGGVCGSVGIEHGSYVGVLKAVQVMLALEESLEPADVLVGGRIEAAIGALLVLNPAGTQPQELLCGRRVVGHGEGREILMVGRAGDLSETMEAGDALGHRKPADDALAFSVAMRANKKAIGVVDDGFNPEDEAKLVVHLDPVLADPVFDAHAFSAGFEVFHHVGLEVAGEFLAEKAKDILGVETQEGMLDKLSEDGAQCLATPKEDVGRKFGLIDCPVVLMELE